MHFLRQIRHLLTLLLGFHRQRPRDSLLMSAGFIISAAALAVMLAIPAGIERIAGNTGQEDIALVIADNVMNSEDAGALSPEEVAVISSLPQVARAADGRALVAPQALAHAKLTQADGVSNSVLLRGVTPIIWEVLGQDVVRTEARIQEGQRQLLVSRTLAQRFPELNQATVLIQQREWNIVGVLNAGGNLWESEIWTDLSAVQATYNRPGRVSSLWVKLASPDDLQGLIQAVKDEPRLQKLKVVGQSEYYQRKTGLVSRFAWYAALGVSILLGAGAILAISTTLSMALDKRRREMATLRALGFDHIAIGIASLLDVLLAGMIATLLAVWVTYLILDGAPFGTASGNLAIYARFSIGTEVMKNVVLYSLILGVSSAVIPLWKTVKGKLVDTLKES